ncbi:hypothetical protein [Paracoccus sp. SSK6]
MGQIRPSRLPGEKADEGVEAFMMGFPGRVINVRVTVTPLISPAS